MTVLATCCWSSFNSLAISVLAALSHVSTSACFSSSRPSTCFLKLLNRRTQSSSLQTWHKECWGEGGGYIPGKGINKLLFALTLCNSHQIHQNHLALSLFVKVRPYSLGRPYLFDIAWSLEVWMSGGQQSSEAGCSEKCSPNMNFHLSKKLRTEKSWVRNFSMRNWNTL